MKFSILLGFFALASQIYLARCATTTRSTISCAIGINTRTYSRNQEILADLIEPYLNINYKIEDKVIVKLFTSENRSGVQLNLNDAQGLKSSGIDFNRNTKIITHGYLNTGNSPSCKLMRDAFLNSGNYNVIVVDWWGMQSLWGWIPITYGRVVKYVPEVTNFVTSMLEFLENNGLKFQTTTLIGHSLGAHIMGVASYQMKNKVNYIVGLDPALPLFENAGPGKRLSTEDANNVEVIHTNEGHCGFSAEIGHFDFYPNGGSKQPGCLTNPCAHGRAYEYYAESISSKDGFFGFHCSDFQEVKGGNCTGDIALMGGVKRWHTRRQRSKINRQGGMYHLMTNGKSPYAMGI